MYVGGRYEIQINWTENSSGGDTVRWIRPKPGETTIDLGEYLFHLKDEEDVPKMPENVELTVVDTLGNPVPNAIWRILEWKSTLAPRATLSHPDFTGSTDESGLAQISMFAYMQNCGTLLVTAPDQKAARLVQLYRDDKVTVTLLPVASVSGRLIDRQSQQPLANVLVNITKKNDWDSTMTWEYGRQSFVLSPDKNFKTDVNGVFRIEGILPEHSCIMHAIKEISPEYHWVADLGNQVNGVSSAGLFSRIDTKNGGHTELGDIPFDASLLKIRPHNRYQEALYMEREVITIYRRLAKAFQNAKANHRNVLVFCYGHDEMNGIDMISEIFSGGDQEGYQRMSDVLDAYEFVTLHIPKRPTSNSATFQLFEKYAGKPIPDWPGVIALVYSADGKLLGMCHRNDVLELKRDQNGNPDLWAGRVEQYILTTPKWEAFLRKNAVSKNGN